MLLLLRVLALGLLGFFTVELWVWDRRMRHSTDVATHNYWNARCLELALFVYTPLLLLNLWIFT